MAVPGAVPTVAGDLVRFADAAGGEHHRPGFEHLELAALALIPEGPHDPLAVLEQRQHADFHVHINTPVDAVILERANHFQSRAVTDVGEPGIFVPAEIALQDPPVRGAVEHGPPGLQFANARRRLAGVELRHAPVIDVLAAAHGVGEMHLPIVPFVHVGQRGRDAAFGHDGVGLAEQALADQAHRDAGRRGLDGRAQAGAAGADDQDVVFDGGILRHFKKCGCRATLPSSRGARRDRRTSPSKGSTTPTPCGGG